jgi:hypothetical protein
MKKLTTKMISFILTLSMVLSLSVPAFAAENYSVSNISDTIGSQEEIEAAREAYASLSPEAKAIFDASLANDPDALEFHKTYIDENFSLPTPRIQTRSANVAAAADVNYVNNLMSRLYAIGGIPSSVLSALRAVGASIAVDIADGPLPVGTILLAASATALATTIALNWDVVSPKLNQISRAFQLTFAEAASNISTAFSKIKAEAKKEADKKAKADSEKRVDDVLKGKTKDRKTSGNTNIYEGSGGQSAAEKDFNKLNKGKTTTYSNGTKVGQLPDGTKINVRPKSSDGRVTLEIQGKGKYSIKIRYK